jgi:plastocyanin
MTRIVFAGATLLALVASAPSKAATVAGGVVLDGAPAGDVVVALRTAGATGARPSPAPDVRPAAAPRRAVMDQKHLAFSPAVLPVLRGTVVEFTNSDDVEHNVFSPSEVAGAFDLGTYASGDARAIALEKPGEVHVLCNIHMEMEAHILVLEEPWFAVTAGDGSFAIAGVPAGDYELALWRDGWLPEKRKVTVPGEGEVRVDVTAER